MRRWTRRGFLASLAGSGLSVERGKGSLFASDLLRFSDPATDLDVYRLTNPQYAAHLPEYYGRAVSRKGQFLICWSERTGSRQGFRINLKTGEWVQITDASALDGSTLTLMPDERSFCYFDGPSLRRADFGKLRDREVYRVPEGWERCPGASVTSDGLYSLFGECRQGASRLQLVGMVKGAAATIAEQPWILSDPVARPRRAQAVYRQGSNALWLANFDGGENRKLKIPAGGVGPARWAADGRTLIYLRFPEDKTQLNTLREHTPDANQDQLISKTSQFVQFDANADTSVFVGASRNRASPHILLLVRAARRELTLCEHRASDAATVAPVFSADSQQVFFQSDKEGKPAIYRIHVERFVAKTEPET